MLAEIDSGYLHSDRGQNVVFEDYGVGFVTFEEHIYQGVTSDQTAI